MFLKSKDFKMIEKRISTIEDNISMINCNLGRIDVNIKEILEKQYDDTYIKDANKSILYVTKKLLKIEKLLEEYTQKLKIDKYFSSYQNNTINLEKKLDGLKIENINEVKEFFAEYIKETMNLRIDVNLITKYFNDEIKRMKNDMEDIKDEFITNFDFVTQDEFITQNKDEEEQNYSDEDKE
ncbi:hypothetical protein [Campylobacter corcagiensis]|uniref:Uncharacterized protein n=1 Tax=Campylobacter corcagiensis TaxID=1448857 RepID=A0A6M8MKK4_9BACT|nr:hypothetical protein [Campylobacter corcagiensis]QKF65554.1 hypothetical protein CCORG_a0018 [Campylobacter corcagiensis]QOQ86538.1 hypothetical protein IMC76_00145 [Campylobacter corcagiensis]